MVIRKEYNEVPKRVVWYIDWIAQGQLLSQVSLREVYNYKKMGIRFVTLPERNVSIHDIEGHSDKTQWSHLESSRETYGFINVSIYPEDKHYTETELYELLELQDPDVFAAKQKVEMKKLYKEDSFLCNSNEWQYRRGGTTTRKVIQAIYASQSAKKDFADTVFYITEYDAAVKYAEHMYRAFMKKLPFVLKRKEVKFVTLQKLKDLKIHPNAGTQIHDPIIPDTYFTPIGVNQNGQFINQNGQTIVSVPSFASDTLEACKASTVAIEEHKSKVTFICGERNGIYTRENA